jgi:hypothetical protein
MGDEQTPQPDDAAVDPVEQAYSDALSGGTDRYGFNELPAREVTAIGGVSAEHAERAARRELEAIQKLRGTSEQRVADPDQQPEQPEPEQQPTEAPELSNEQAAERLLYGSERPAPEQDLSPEQAAAIEALQAKRAFHSGEAAQAAVEAEGEYKRAHEELIELPGITTDAFMEYVEAPWTRMVDAYGLEPESTASLDVLRQLYEQSGGAQRWSGEAEAHEQAQAYEKALSGGGPRDTYGFPTAEPAE